ncbi:MAG: hypothetical protein CMI03_19850 [Oceanospirillaceae bacterium]|nr:hypothetical protein [Oceanospirillaceae bacterium]
MARLHKQTWLPVLIVAVVISLTTSLFLYFQIMQSAQKDLASVVSQVARQWQQQALRPGSSNTPHAERSDIHFQIVSRQENDNVVSHFSQHKTIRAEDIRAALSGAEGFANYRADGKHILAFYQPLNDRDALVAVTSMEDADRGHLVMSLSLFLISLLVSGVFLLLYQLLQNRRRNNHPSLNALEKADISSMSLLLSDNFVVTDLSPGVTQKFGLQTGDQLLNVFAGQTDKDVLAHLTEVSTHGIPVSFECRLRDREGKTSVWSVQATPWHQQNHDYIVLHAQDISRRSESEADLASQQARVNAYFNAMQTALISCNNEGHVVRVNQSALHLLQMTEQQVLNQPFQHLLTPPAREAFQRSWQQIPDAPGDSSSATFPLLASSGREYILRWQITRLSADGESQENILFAGLDITVEVANREALEKANARIFEALEEAEKANRSKSIFLASMSHEIRTPMNGILGATELMMDTGVDEDQNQYLQIIHSSSHVLLDIINDILDLSKIESGKLEVEKIRYDLNELLTSLYQLFKEPARRKGISLVYIYDGDLPQYWFGDPKRTRQIITNLLSNALKFTHDGCIELHVSGNSADQRNFRISIAVQDQGIGIPEEKHKQIFEAFRQADSTTSRQYGGTGLGLTISQHLARAMGGDLLLQSTVGEGSTFTLSLPLRQADAPKVERRKNKPSLPGLRGHVLLAEDNMVNQKITSKMLDRLGVKVTVAGNGEEAIVAVMEGDFDVVLMDVNMPVLDGIAATERIRDLSSARKDIPIIALTANAMLQDRQRCLEAGMNGFVAKPLRMEDLASALTEVLPPGRQAFSTSPSNSPDR